MDRNVSPSPNPFLVIAEVSSEPREYVPVGRLDLWLSRATRPYGKMRTSPGIGINLPYFMNLLIESNLGG